MEWLAENATNVYFLLGFAAFMLAGVWWIQKQTLYLAGAGAALIALLVAWLVLRNLPTSADSIEANLQALGKAVVAKDHDAAARYVADGFKYNRKTTEKWLAYLGDLVEENSVDAVAITGFKLKKKEGGEAHVAFHLEARAKGKSVYAVECPDWTLKRTGDVWQIAKVKLSKAKDDDNDP